MYAFGVLRHTSGAHFDHKSLLTEGSRQSPTQPAALTEGTTAALLFFTEYLYVYKVFQLSNIKKSGLPILPLMGSFGSPLRFNLELKLKFLISGAGTHPRSR